MPKWEQPNEPKTQPVIETCTYCVGMKGKPKNMYSSEAKANDARRYREAEQRISLQVYLCPHGMGWHLKTTRLIAD